MRLWHVLAFIVLLAVFAAIQAPASLLAPSRPDAFSYARSEGSIWRAQFFSARLHGVQLGDLDWAVQPEALLQGRLGGAMSASGGALTGAGRMSVGLDGGVHFSADRLDWRPLALVPGAGESGAASATGVAIAFQAGQCREARGEAQADLLAGAPAGLAVTAPPLFGRFACDGTAAVLKMTGEQDGGQVEVTLRLLADGAGAWRVQIRPADPLAAAPLTAAGFAPPDANGFLARSGDLRWRPT